MIGEPYQSTSKLDPERQRCHFCLNREPHSIEEHRSCIAFSPIIIEKFARPVEPVRRVFRANGLRQMRAEGKI